jgi:hypothetical protein
MGDDSEPLSAPDVLRSTILGDALGLVMGCEELAAHRYRDLASLVDSQARPALLALYADASRNVELLRQIEWTGTDQAELTQQQLLGIRLCTERLSRAILLPEFDDEPVEDEVLRYAEDCEHLTHAYYCCLASLVWPGPLQDLFRRLRDQKRRHEEAVHECCDALFLLW